MTVAIMSNSSRDNIGKAGLYRQFHNQVPFESTTGTGGVTILTNFSPVGQSIVASRMLRLKVLSPYYHNAQVNVHAVHEDRQKAVCIGGIKRRKTRTVAGSPLLANVTSGVLALNAEHQYEATIGPFYFKELSSHHQGKKFAISVVVCSGRHIIYAGISPFFEVRDRTKGSKRRNTKSSTASSGQANKRQRENVNGNQKRERKIMRLEKDRMAVVQEESNAQGYDDSIQHDADQDSLGDFFLDGFFQYFYLQC